MVTLWARDEWAFRGLCGGLGWQDAGRGPSHTHHNLQWRAGARCNYTAL